MSTFMDKLLKGISPTAQEWEQHLIQAHAEAPSMSAETFASCKNAQGQNSYEWTAQELSSLRSPDCVVDLACGDGHLVPYLDKVLPATCRIIGIDMAAAGLELARRQATRCPAEYREAFAQETKLAPKSVDAVVCHMGLMLMLPVEPVIQEILRVLKPGGLFVAVVTNRQLRAGSFKTILEIVEKTLHQEFPQMAAPKTGDPRTLDKDGIETLFRNGAKLVKMEDDNFGREATPQESWDHVKNMYLLGGMPLGVRERVHAEVIGTLSSNSSPTQRFDFAFRKFTLRKL